MTEDATRGYLIVAVLFLAALTSVVSGTLLSPLLPAIAADLDVSVAAAGQLGTVSAVVSVVVALAATPWMDRFPRSTWRMPPNPARSTCARWRRKRRTPRARWRG